MHTTRKKASGTLTTYSMANIPYATCNDTSCINHSDTHQESSAIIIFVAYSSIARNIPLTTFIMHTQKIDTKTLVYLLVAILDTFILWRMQRTHHPLCMSLRDDIGKQPYPTIVRSMLFYIHILHYQATISSLSLLFDTWYTSITTLNVFHSRYIDISASVMSSSMNDVG